MEQEARPCWTRLEAKEFHCPSWNTLLRISICRLLDGFSASSRIPLHPSVWVRREGDIGSSYFAKRRREGRHSGQCRYWCKQLSFRARTRGDAQAEDRGRRSKDVFDGNRTPTDFRPFSFADGFEYRDRK